MICKICSIEFKPEWRKNGVSKFCSRECYRSDKRLNNSVILNCSTCHKDFVRFRCDLVGQKLHYCSNNCRPRIIGLQKGNCKFCNKELERYASLISKTGNWFCNASCSIQQSISEGNRNCLKSQKSYYFNKWENKEVLLESSWELKCATILDELEIKWIRPKSIEWNSLDNKKHKYYPDFYLEDYNLYVDPKNPWVLKKDEGKLKILKEVNKIKLLVGHIKMIEEEIRSLNNRKK